MGAYFKQTTYKEGFFVEGSKSHSNNRKRKDTEHVCELISSERLFSKGFQTFVHESFDCSFFVFLQ